MIQVTEFFDAKTSTLTYVVYDDQHTDAVVIDPVWNFDPASGKLSGESVAKVTEYLKSEGFQLHAILETHAHADHISGAQLLKKEFPQAKVLVNERICQVQKTFKDIYNLPHSFPTDGSQFDGLLKDGSIIRAGQMEFKVLFTPGHTPACTSFLFKGVVFTGDTLFMPDSGTGRCDFPEGSATDLFQSVCSKLYSLPNETLTYTGHDYQPGGRPLKFKSSIKEQKESNIHIKSTTTEEEFVQFRTGRDKTLSAPQLLLPALQVNIRGGRLPEQESNGVSYLRIPLREL